MRLPVIIVNLQGNYNRKIAPFVFDEDTWSNIPANVSVSMAVTDILKIEEVDHVYTMKFRLVLEWWDGRTFKKNSETIIPCMRMISVIFKDGLQTAVLQPEEGAFSKLAFSGRNPGNSPNQSTIVKYREVLNSIPPSPPQTCLQALWLPFLVFSNTENNEATKPTEDTELTITRY